MVFSMMRSVPKREAAFGEYRFSKLAMDSADAPDRPIFLVKRYKANAASRPCGKKRRSVCEAFHHAFHEKVSPGSVAEHEKNVARRDASVIKCAQADIRRLYWNITVSAVGQSNMGN